MVLLVRTTGAAAAAVRRQWAAAAVLRPVVSARPLSRLVHAPQPQAQAQAQRPGGVRRQPLSTAPTTDLSVLGTTYVSDDYTNVPASILSRLAPQPTLPYTPQHPLCHLRSQIETHFGAAYTPIRAPSPVVSTHLNFEELGFPPDHPGRSPTDTYYVNRTTCLRTHTSAHEVETFRAGHERWLLTADVYRRDEIDASHYPVFHQMEGAAIFSPDAYAPAGLVEKECEAMEARLAMADLKVEDDVDLNEAGGYQPSHDPRAASLAVRHLKASLNGLALSLFGPRQAAEGEPLRVRWIPATFPFTSPSFEVEVWFRGKWLEILGCGVVMDKTLHTAAVPNKLGWAFGLGLERIAMVLFSIPDIRLFWTQDRRFLDQFATHSPSNLVTFKPYSKFPPCYKDVSFWIPEQPVFHENNFFELVRDQVGDLAEDVVKIDDFTHPKTKRRSLCYRINYRSMDRYVLSRPQSSPPFTDRRLTLIDQQLTRKRRGQRPSL